MALTVEILAILACVAFIAGFVDAIAGGGGLITIPSLLLAGLDPVSAIATNKLQGSFGTASSTYAFWQAGKLDWHETWPMFTIAFFVSMLGALIVEWLPKAVVIGAVPLVLIAVALYFAFSAALRDVSVRARLSRLAFCLLPVPVIAFYDGAFGPGAGSFYMLAFAMLLGLDAVQATGRTKLLNFGSNLGSLGMFLLSGVVIWSAGLVMAVACMAGSRLGAGLAMRFGAGLIRPLVVIICIAMALRLLLDRQHPVWLLASRLLSS
jgi:uncharacterized protein